LVGNNNLSQSSFFLLGEFFIIMAHWGDLLDKIVKHANVLHGFAIGLPKKAKP
jgi:hypothetical protein